MNDSDRSENYHEVVFYDHSRVRISGYIQAKFSSSFSRILRISGLLPTPQIRQVYGSLAGQLQSISFQPGPECSTIDECDSAAAVRTQTWNQNNSVSSDYCVSLFSDCNGMEDLEGKEHGHVSVASNSIASLFSDGAVLGHIAIGLI